MRKLITQIIKFIGISGLGWLLDFSIYTVLTTFAGVPVFYANMMSSIPSVTMVFLVSTRKIFVNGGRLPVWAKYIVYLAYQLVLIFLVSAAASRLAPWIANLFDGQFANISKILAKILITPITMTLNFIVMKFMTERL